MSIFDHFTKEKVTLIKTDGQTFELDALVQSKKILTEDPRVPIEDGDTFERRLPSGVVERFTIVDAGFQPGLGPIPPHYQSVVRKSTAAPPTHSSIVYNLVGANSRVNIQSKDASTNVVSVDSSVLFKNLKDAVRESPMDEAASRRVLERVEAMESAAGTDGFGQCYKDFIASAADHMTLFAPFLPALSQLLT